MIITARRNTALSRGEFFEHLRHRHWDVLKRYPEPFALLQGYYQNHALGDTAPPELRAPFRVALERDSVIELWFESIEALTRLVQLPDYLQYVRPDEAAFNDLASNIMVHTTPVTYFQVSSVGRCKRFDFISRAPGTTAEQFANELDTQARALVREPYYTGHVDRHLHNLVQPTDEGHGFGAGTFDCVREVSASSFHALSAVSDYSELRGVDAAASFSIFATEFIMVQPGES
jgi:hypothetical protein